MHPLKHHVAHSIRHYSPVEATSRRTPDVPEGLGRPEDARSGPLLVESRRAGEFQDSQGVCGEREWLSVWQTGQLLQERHQMEVKSCHKSSLIYNM